MATAKDGCVHRREGNPASGDRGPHSRPSEELPGLKVLMEDVNFTIPIFLLGDQSTNLPPARAEAQLNRAR